MQWIRCKKRLPEVRQIVLITDGYQVGIGFRGAFGMESKFPFAFYRPVTFEILNGITAWKPLPKPYFSIEQKRKRKRR